MKLLSWNLQRGKKVVASAGTSFRRLGMSHALLALLCPPILSLPLRPSSLTILRESDTNDSAAPNNSATEVVIFGHSMQEGKKPKRRERGRFVPLKQGNNCNSPSEVYRCKFTDVWDGCVFKVLSAAR